jgi:ABC-type nitrate/sulfonate/bicarbonate transport system ATPase subunit
LNAPEVMLMHEPFAAVHTQTRILVLQVERPRIAGDSRLTMLTSSGCARWIKQVRDAGIAVY